MTPKVHIAMPTTGHIRAETVVWIMSYAHQRLTAGFSFNIGCIGVAVQRNTLVEEFLKSESTHLFFLDDDVVPPMDYDVFVRMTDHDKDIVTGVYPLFIKNTRISSIYYLHEGVIYDTNDDASMQQELTSPVIGVREGLERCDAAGAGCLMIKREVIEAIPPPWFHFPPFDSRDHRVGEDIFFGLRAKQYGFDMYVDWDLHCRHYKQIGWLP